MIETIKMIDKMIENGEHVSELTQKGLKAHTTRAKTKAERGA